METYLIDLALHEIFPIPKETERNFKEIAGRLAEKLRNGSAQLVNFELYSGYENDNHDDGQIPAVCNETLFEVILGIDESVDLISSKEPVVNYLIEALENRDGLIESAFDTPGEGCLRTVVRLTLFHLDTSSMDDYHELMDRL